MSRRKSMPLWLSFIIIAAIAFGYMYWKKHDEKNNGGADSGSDVPSLFDELPAGGDGNLNVYFLDVGQGDCILIEFPDNKTMLIDSGDNKSHCEEKIDEFAEMLDISRFDYLLLTHADADHVGSMDYVLKNYEVGKVFRPNVLSAHDLASSLDDGINVGVSKENGGKEATSRAYYDFLYYLQQENCEWEIFNKDSDFSGSYTVEDEVYSYTFDFLTPVAPVEEIKYSDANDYSPIVTLTYNGVVIMLTGDAETEMEKEFMEYYEGAYPDCDLLKVGHHGSSTSTSQAFLNAVQPEYAVIQCGKDNRYNHPRQAVLDRLKGVGCNTYRNDTNGDIALSISYEDGFVLTAEGIFCTNTEMKDNFIGGDV